MIKKCIHSVDEKFVYVSPEGFRRTRCRACDRAYRRSGVKVRAPELNAHDGPLYPELATKKWQ